MSKGASKDRMPQTPDLHFAPPSAIKQESGVLICKFWICGQEGALIEYTWYLMAPLRADQLHEGAWNSVYASRGLSRACHKRFKPASSSSTPAKISCGKRCSTRSHSPLKAANLSFSSVSRQELYSAT